jgi:hypothetical protein
MPISRNSVRLAALVAALTLTGCGSSKGEEGGGDCNPDAVQKGCVAIMNFRSTAVTFGGVSIPPRHPGSAGGTAPGATGVMLSDSSLNSKHPYQGTIGGQNVNVTCTVTNLGWISVNPSVVIQQEAFGALVNCENW